MWIKLSRVFLLRSQELSYHCDGLEGVFSVESLNNLSVEDIKKAVDENKIKEKSLTLRD